MRLENNTILITGGCSGWGLDLAAELIRRNNTVLVTSGSAKSLQQAERLLPRLKTFLCDIGKPAQLQKLLKALRIKYQNLNVLINHAEIKHKYSVYAEEQALPLINEEIRLNLLAAINLTQQILPFLLSSVESAVVNFSSIQALVPSAAAPVYSATRAGMHAFSRALRQQLEGSPVRVFEIFPPPGERVVDDTDNLEREHHQQTIQAMIRGLQSNRDEIAVGRAGIIKVVSRFSPALAGWLI